MGENACKRPRPHNLVRPGDELWVYGPAVCPLHRDPTFSRRQENVLPNFANRQPLLLPVFVVRCFCFGWSRSAIGRHRLPGYKLAEPIPDGDDDGEETEDHGVD